MRTVDRTLPAPGPPRPFAFPTLARTQLENGLHVRAISHPSVPVTATVLLPGGSSADATEQAGLASLTADLLDEGSRGQSALEISDRIARMGGDLDLEVSHDATVISLATLCRSSTRSARFRTWRSRISSACGSSGSSGCDSFAIIRRRSPTARARCCTDRIRTQPGHGTATSLGA